MGVLVLRLLRKGEGSKTEGGVEEVDFSSFMG